MKLTDLNPRWVGAGGEGVCDKDGNPVPERHGVGVMFRCPCGTCPEWNECYIPFANPLDGGPSLHPGPKSHPTWQRTGDSFATLTLTPSIHRRGGCGWHGFITNGQVVGA